MATVGQSKYGVAVEYTNGAKTTFWFQTQQDRDKRYAKLNRDKKVKTAKRVQR